MDLHESLAALASDHGEGLFLDADAFRGAVDDYLDESSASTGTVNLLTDAVRLGALQAMLAMLDSGAGVDDAVDSAGQRLARDRGSRDVTGAQWACAVLGFALGRVPESLATRLTPDALTSGPPHQSSSQATGAQPTVVSPPHQPIQSPPQTPPTQSPAAQWPQQQPGPAPSWQSPPSTPQGPGTSPYQGGSGSWGAPPPRKSPVGLIIALSAVAVVLVVGVVIGVIALTGDDEPNAGGDATTSETGTADTTPPTESSSPTDSASAVDPALTLQGTGYTYQFPDASWQDLTDTTPNSTGTIDSISAPGKSLSTARGNVLVEVSSTFGETDFAALEQQWRSVLTSSTGATPTDFTDRQIGGKDAAGVQLEWTNANNFKVRQIAYLVVSGDQQYSITASFRQGDSDFENTFLSILDTWTWQ